MKIIKNLLSIILVFALLFAFTACTSQNSESTQTSENSEQTQESAEIKTAQELTEIIIATRGEDENNALPIIAGDENGVQTLHNPLQLTEADLQTNTDMLLQATNIDIENCETFAFSVASTIVNAYGVGIFYPKEGSEEQVKESLEAFVLQKQSEFENYLPDQYEIAQNGIVEYTSDGALVLIVAANSQDVLSAINEQF